MIVFRRDVAKRVRGGLFCIMLRFSRWKPLKKKYKQSYVNKFDVKASRSKKQRRTWQEIYKERFDTSYGPRIALVTSAPNKKQRKESGKNDASNTWKCGSTMHKRTTHRKCPLQKRKEGHSVGAATVATPLQQPSVASAVVRLVGSSAPTNTGIENEGF